MALVTCPDCGREVSDRAPACPHCGAPIASAAAYVAPGPVQTIEQTGKHWKLLQAGGCAVMVLSVLTCSGIAESDWAMTVGALGMLGGLVMFIAGRAGAWWHHG